MEWKIQDAQDLKKITGGLLIQDRDNLPLDRPMQTVTKAATTEDEWTAMQIAWVITQYVKSNAIVFTTADTTVACWRGQMSRVDSVKIAKLKAQNPVEVRWSVPTLLPVSRRSR